MKRMILFVLIVNVLVLAGCGASVPTPTKTPIPQAQNTPTPTAAPIPTESSAQALSPDGKAVQRLLAIFLFHAVVREGIRTTAADIESKKITGMYGFGEIIANGVFLKAAGEALAKDFPAPLATFVDIAKKQQADLSSILRRWMDKEISSTDIPAELQNINTDEALKSFVTSMQKFGITRDQIDQMIARIDATMKKK